MRERGLMISRTDFGRKRATMGHRWWDIMMSEMPANPDGTYKLFSLANLGDDFKILSTSPFLDTPPDDLMALITGDLGDIDPEYIDLTPENLRESAMYQRMLAMYIRRDDHGDMDIPRDRGGKHR